MYNFNCSLAGDLERDLRGERDLEERRLGERERERERDLLSLAGDLLRDLDLDLERDFLLSSASLAGDLERDREASRCGEASFTGEAEDSFTGSSLAGEAGAGTSLTVSATGEDIMQLLLEILSSVSTSAGRRKGRGGFFGKNFPGENLVKVFTKEPVNFEV